MAPKCSLDEKQLAAFKALIDAGQPYNLIAERFAMTRSGVAGIVHRKGWGKGGGRAAQPHRPRMPPRPEDIPKPAPAPACPPAPAHDALDYAYAAASRPGVDLMALEPHHCRWPHGSSDFRFCAAPRAAGSYCAAHHKLAYSPQPKRAFVHPKKGGVSARNATGRY